MHQKLQKYSLESFEWFANYKWLQIFWLPEEHEIAFNEFMKLDPKKDAAILILWSWTGAFDQRLIDNWFSNITSTDFLWDSYAVQWTNFFQSDLNSEKWDFFTQNFDYVFAIEVVEHLENQFHFLRNINKVLSPEWNLIISTPNITNQYSKANFIVKGQLAHFSEVDLQHTGHIQIIAPHIFQYNYESSGYSLISYTNEWKYSLKLDRTNLRSFIGFFVYSFLMLFLWWNKNQIDMYTLKKGKWQIA